MVGPCCGLHRTPKVTLLGLLLLVASFLSDTKADADPSWEQRLGLWPLPMHTALSNQAVLLDLQHLEVLCEPSPCTQLMLDAASRFQKDAAGAQPLGASEQPPQVAVAAAPARQLVLRVAGHDAAAAGPLGNGESYHIEVSAPPDGEPRVIVTAGASAGALHALQVLAQLCFTALPQSSGPAAAVHGAAGQGSRRHEQQQPLLLVGSVQDAPASGYRGLLVDLSAAPPAGEGPAAHAAGAVGLPLAALQRAVDALAANRMNVLRLRIPAPGAAGSDDASLFGELLQYGAARGVAVAAAAEGGPGAAAAGPDLLPEDDAEAEEAAQAAAIAQGLVASKRRQLLAGWLDTLLGGAPRAGGAAGDGGSSVGISRDGTSSAGRQVGTGLRKKMKKKKKMMKKKKRVISPAGGGGGQGGGAGGAGDDDGGDSDPYRRSLLSLGQRLRFSSGADGSEPYLHPKPRGIARGAVAGGSAAAAAQLVGSPLAGAIQAPQRTWLRGCGSDGKALGCLDQDLYGGGPLAEVWKAQRSQDSVHALREVIGAEAGVTLQQLLLLQAAAPAAVTATLDGHPAESASTPAPASPPPPPWLLQLSVVAERLWSGAQPGAQEGVKAARARLEAHLSRTVARVLEAPLEEASNRRGAAAEPA